VLLMNWYAFLCLAALMFWSRYRLEILQQQLDEAEGLESLEMRSPR
jgi:hypothetical protein